MGESQLDKAVKDAIHIERDQLRSQLLEPEHIDATKRTVNTRYTPEFKMQAAIYYSMGLPYGIIAEKLGISKSTVHEWVHAYKADLTMRNAVEQVTESLPSRAYLVASRLIGSMSDDKIEKASLRDTAFATKVLVETARLENNKSTANISVIRRNATEAKTSLSHLDDQITALRNELLLESASGNDLGSLDDIEDPVDNWD